MFDPTTSWQQQNAIRSSLHHEHASTMRHILFFLHILLVVCLAVHRVACIDLTFHGLAVPWPALPQWWEDSRFSNNHGSVACVPHTASCTLRGSAMHVKGLCHACWWSYVMHVEELYHACWTGSIMHDERGCHSGIHACTDGVSRS